MFDPQERHYSVQELADAWHVSTDMIRRLFIDEPGVLNFAKPKARKRIYQPIRIPQGVADRVYQRLTQTGGRP